MNREFLPHSTAGNPETCPRRHARPPVLQIQATPKAPSGSPREYRAWQPNRSREGDSAPTPIKTSIGPLQNSLKRARIPNTGSARFYSFDDKD